MGVNRERFTPKTPSAISPQPLVRFRWYKCVSKESGHGLSSGIGLVSIAQWAHRKHITIRVGGFSRKRQRQKWGFGQLCPSISRKLTSSIFSYPYHVYNMPLWAENSPHLDRRPRGSHPDDVRSTPFWHQKRTSRGVFSSPTHPFFMFLGVSDSPYSGLQGSTRIYKDLHLL